MDWRDARPGDKQFHWEQRGVPFRIEVGPRDVDGESFILKHRLGRKKEAVALADVSPGWFRGKLDAMQAELLERARTFRTENTHRASTYDELKSLVQKGGFVRCYFEPDEAAEEQIQNETKASVRVIPFDQPEQPGTCIVSDRETRTEVLFAQAY